MIIELLLDSLFSFLYAFVDTLSDNISISLTIPTSVTEFISEAFSLLSYFVPLNLLAPLLSYHMTILALRFQMMILGFIKRIPLA